MSRLRTNALVDWLLPPNMRITDHPDRPRARTLAMLGLTGTGLMVASIVHRLTDPAMAELSLSGAWFGVCVVVIAGVLLRSAAIELAAGVLFSGAAIAVSMDALQWGMRGGASFAAMLCLPVVGSFVMQRRAVLFLALGVSAAILGIGFQGPQGPSPVDSEVGRFTNVVVSMGLLWGVTLASLTKLRERREIQERLAEREARYASAIAAAGAGVFQWHPAEGVREVSDRFRELLGENSAFEGLEVEGGGSVFGAMGGLLHGQRRRVLARRVTADGSEEWFQFELLGTHTPSGPAVTGVVHDVTDARRTERLKEEFIAVVSHELRSPLTSIHGAVALLRARPFLGIDPDAISARDELLTIAANNSHRLLVLVNDLLDAQALDGGALALETAELPAGEVAWSAVRSFDSFAAERRVQLSLDNRTNGAVLADRRRLEQVIGHLISNACKVSRPGGEVRVSTEVREGWLRITVADAGPGVPESFREHVFERFTQSNTSINRPRGGAGLGLHLARGLAERMGGRVDFASVTGNGATFWVEFPMVAQAPQQDAEAEAATG